MEGIGDVIFIDRYTPNGDPVASTNLSQARDGLGSRDAKFCIRIADPSPIIEIVNEDCAVKSNAGFIDNR